MNRITINETRYQKSLMIRLTPLAGLCTTLLLASLGAAPLELDILRQQYDKSAVEPFVTAKTELDAKFSVALENAVAAAKQGGRLEEVLALQEDQKRLAGAIPIPENDAGTPESLIKLRTIYREQVAQIEMKRAATHAEILPVYIAKLQELEATLTKADRIPDALSVKAHRDSLGPGLPPVAKTAAPATDVAMPPAGPAPATAPPAPTSSAKVATAAVIGDDRKAAEWVLSVGGSIEIFEGSDRSRPVRTLADLPPGKFGIRRILLNNNSGGLKPVSDDALAVLAGLRSLEMVVFSKLGITPAALDVLRTCPSLDEISLQYNRLGDELWPHLQGIKLKKLAQGYDDLPVLGLGISQLDSESMVDLWLNSTEIGDAALPEIAGFTNLTTLNLSETKITDAGIVSLAPLRKLKMLHVWGTDVTLNGLRSLKGVPIESLGYGRNMVEFLSQLPELVGLFPELKKIHLPRNVNPTTEDWKAIAETLPKLENLEIRNQKFSNENCDGMELLTNLTNVFFYDSPLDDAGIATLARSKKLRRLEIPAAKITDISLATLAEMRSLKELVLPKPGNGLTAAAIEKFKGDRPDIFVR